MARLVPWQVVEAQYGTRFRRDRGGHRPLTARIALGSLIVKERLGLTDREETRGQKRVDRVDRNAWKNAWTGT